MGLLDLVFPKGCVACGQIGTYLCDNDRQKITPTKSFCPVCLKPAVGGTTHSKCKAKLSLDGLICLFRYATPVKEVIHELKYRFVTDLVNTIAEESAKSIRLSEIDFSAFILAPIPLSRFRKNWRGFNQAEIIGKPLASEMKIPFLPEILVKTKETSPQAKLFRQERLKQVRGSFKTFVDKEEIIGQNYLLFDDVWTTGATMKAAASVLKRKGANRVWGLVLASGR